jgi:hypothetical protein
MGWDGMDWIDLAQGNFLVAAELAAPPEGLSSMSK